MNEQLPIIFLAFVYHTLWQYPLTIPLWLSRTLCANQIQKKHIPSAAGRPPSETQNRTKQMIPFPSVSLPDLVIPCCIFQHKPWTELFSGLMLLLNEMLFIQNICLLFQRIFVLNTWFSLCLHLIYQESCHLCFSFQWHESILFIYRVGYFLNQKTGTWGRGGTSLPKKIKDSKMRNTEHFNWTTGGMCIHKLISVINYGKWIFSCVTQPRLEPDQRLYVPEELNNSSTLAQGLSCTPYVCSLLLTRSWWCVIDAGFSSTLLTYTVGCLFEELLLLVS